jgi:hypothetical protein
MNYKPIKWPLKEILKRPREFLKSMVIDYHLSAGIKNQLRANKHNLAAGVMLNLITKDSPALPPDDQLWVVIVATPVPKEHKENLSEWHLWGIENSAPLNDVLSRLPGRVIYMKSIAMIRAEIYKGITQPKMETSLLMPGDKTKWIQ